MRIANVHFAPFPPTVRPTVSFCGIRRRAISDIALVGVGVGVSVGVGLVGLVGRYPLAT